MPNPDAVGMTNREEFNFGYDPTDPGSWAELPAVTLIGLSAIVLLAFAAVVRRMRHDKG